MKPILEIQHIGKEFFIGGQPERYLSLRDILSNPFKKLKQPKVESFWALEDVSFDIMPGESVGIIGRNGAGKSTLLKILSKITPPTKGKIICRGRIASLLEVGTGFHAELTGRENIYMNGSILGMRKKEIDKHFDAIVDFSGVEQFLDTPLKRYSSGMQLRLAFAVAAHLEPEILVIDEVLAVGDAAFQKKCIGKMGDVAKEGKTLIFVSHDLSAVTTLTTRAVLLNKGKVEYVGDTQTTIEKYASQTKKLSDFFIGEAHPGLPSITSVKLITSEGQTLQSSGKALSVIIDINMPVNREGMALAIQIFNQNNTSVVFNWIFDYETPFCRVAGKNRLILTYKKLSLYKGNYYLKMHLAETNNARQKFAEFDCCNFEVEMIDQKAPEWGWQNNVCQYIEEGSWEIL
jgi:lipopolysaccharide transport system ATP-binding protein